MTGISGMSKYNNRKVSVGGITFDSKKEATRWQQLRLAEAEGAISNLQRQVVYEIAPAVVLDGRKRPARKYVADFQYHRSEGDSVALVVEDVKGMKLPEYRLKRHLMKAIHNIEVKEV